jgi:hypothetical protein
LQELHDAQLIDDAVGSGTRNGYTFQLHRSPDAPEWKWMVTAAPVELGHTGDQYYAANQDGVAYYRTDAPFELNDECRVDVEGAEPIVRRRPSEAAARAGSQPPSPPSSRRRSR